MTSENYFSGSFRFRKERRLPKTLSADSVHRILDFAEQQAAEYPNSCVKARNLALIDLLICTGIMIGERQIYLWKI